MMDDGCGFDVSALPPPHLGGSGYGMGSMAERAELFGGRLEVWSRPDNGTTLMAKVPFQYFGSA